MRIKKCVQKVNHLLLRGKIGRLWVSLLFVLPFFCSLVSGTTASALVGSYSLDTVKYRYCNETTVQTAQYNYVSRTFIIPGDGSHQCINRIQFVSQYHPTLTKGQKYFLSFQVSFSDDSPRVPTFLNMLPNADSTFQGAGEFSLDRVEQNISNSIGNSSSTYSSPNETFRTYSSSLTSYYFYGEVAKDLNPWQGYYLLGGALVTQIGDPLPDIYISTPSMVFYEPSDAAADAIKEQEEKEKSETNAQVQAGDSAANSSSSDASQSGSTLLAAAQSFVGALTSASPSNCTLDMDLGNLDLGNANLCSISPPPAFQVISSIVLIGFCVPLSIATAKKMVSLFRSFQS